MNILILSPTQPIPTNDGARLRIFNFIKNFSKKNSITLITLNHKDGSYKKDLDLTLSKYCQKVFGVKHFKPKTLALFHWFLSDKPYRHVKFYNGSFKKTLYNELVNTKYDVVFCNFLDMAQYLENIKIHCKSTLFVIDQHNADELWYEKFAKMESLLLKIYGIENLKRLRRRQRNEYKIFDLCLSVSEEDAEFTNRLLNNSMKVFVSPNGVDHRYFFPTDRLDSDSVILFCGSMDTTMNQDAVQYFCREIFPKIKIRQPNAQFLIVGRNPPKRIKKLHNNKNIIVTGTVSDVRPFYEKASVVVAPFRLGGGTKLKILEAMAMKVPIVTTLTGCQGIIVENGKHLCISDDDSDFAEKVTECLSRRPDKMINEAHNLVLKQYTWKSITEKAEMLMRKMLKRKIKNVEGMDHGVVVPPDNTTANSRALS